MPLIQLLVVLIIIGVLLWLVETYIPMDPGIKQLIRVVAIIVAVVIALFWLLDTFGLTSSVMTYRPGRR